MLNVPSEIISEIAKMVDVDWIDRAIGETKKKRRSFEFTQQPQTFQDQLPKLQKQQDLLDLK